MSKRGFTIVELLVAMTITLVLAGLLLATTANLLQVWRRTQSSASKAVDGKLVLDQIERDLQSAIARIDGFASLDARLVTNLSAQGWDLSANGVIKPLDASLRLLPPVPADGSPQSIAAARFGRSGVWLRFIASDYDSATGSSAPSAIGYQIVRRKSSQNSTIQYALYRTKVSAENTFNGVLGVAFSDTTPTALNSPSTLDVIATNAVDFGVWISSVEANGLETRLFPNASGTAFSGDSAARSVWAMVRILTDEGAAQIDAIENGRLLPPAGRNAEEWWWEIVEANSRVFVRRVSVIGGRL